MGNISATQFAEDLAERVSKLLEPLAAAKKPRDAEDHKKQEGAEGEQPAGQTQTGESTTNQSVSIDEPLEGSKPKDEAAKLRQILAEILSQDPTAAQCLEDYKNPPHDKLEFRKRLTDAVSRNLAIAYKLASKVDLPAPLDFVRDFEQNVEIPDLRAERELAAFAARLVEILEASDDDAAKSRSMRTEKTLKDEWPMSPAIESYDDFKKALSEDKSDAVGLLAKVLKDDDRFRASPSGVIGWTKVYSDGNFVGLALSGGGIRSATFNLGVLQGMARCGLLPYFDYLSTVSGGGYIGSWFAAWLKRKGFTKVCHQLRPEWRGQAGEETPEVQFLRSYSNYLTPQLGLLSADTWALVATYVRNLLLNLAILVLGISAVLLLPRLLVVVSNGFYATPRQLHRLTSVSIRHIGAFLAAHGSYVWSNLKIVLNDSPTVCLDLSSLSK